MGTCAILINGVTLGRIMFDPSFSFGYESIGNEEEHLNDAISVPPPVLLTPKLEFSHRSFCQRTATANYCTYQKYQHIVLVHMRMYS